MKKVIWKSLYFIISKDNVNYRTSVPISYNIKPSKVIELEYINLYITLHFKDILFIKFITKKQYFEGIYNRGNYIVTPKVDIQEMYKTKIL